jgi:flagellar hook-associated protein 3 FlgL
MRISTSQIFDMGSSRLAELQASIAKTQQQISSNTRVLTPADDPVAAASALGVSQAISMNDQFAVNRNNAKGALSQEESVMASVTTLLQNVKTLVVNGGNGSLDDTQRKDIASQLQSNLDELLSSANSRDSEGNYIFAGYQTGAVPFTKTATGIVYSGDQGQRLLQVGASRQMAVSDSGSSVFESSMTGNGKFVTTAGTGNTGSGVINAGSVIDPSQLNGQSYSLAFTVDPTTGATTYLVTETPTPAIPATPQPYVDGQNITVGGTQFAITGKPANGDTFSVAPSTDQSIFTTISNLIDALSTTASGSTNQTKLANALNTANNNIDNALSNVSTVRASIGSRLAEIDDLDSAGSDLKIQYTKTLNDLVNIDPEEAYSSFVQQSYTLDAARQTFMKIAGLSLFDMMR